MKTIDRTKLPCKYEHYYTDWVPYGSTNVPMQSFECNYTGNKPIEDVPITEECSSKCIGYESVEVFVCQKHNEEYYDTCSQCEEEMWK